VSGDPARAPAVEWLELVVRNNYGDTHSFSVYAVCAG
jgi:hypothetical protein